MAGFIMVFFIVGMVFILYLLLTKGVKWANARTKQNYADLAEAKKIREKREAKEKK